MNKYWYPVDTKNVFATDNSGPWFKGGFWVKDVDRLPLPERASVIKEILATMADKRPYTNLREGTAAELKDLHCCVATHYDTKKSGDITLCREPAKYVRYWVARNHFMGRLGYCEKHMREKHGSDPMRMHAEGQSPPVIGKAKK